MSAKPEDTRPDMVTIEVDGVPLEAPKGSMLIEATDQAHIHIPRFCYHRKLSVAANCRMCLVEVERAPKPLPACATPVADGMKVFTQSPRAVAAQRGVMEFLLINHPLDCPICDQGGECELQDLAMGYGRGVSRFAERKRVVRDENLGPLVATDMTRCIHCTRCVRFLDEVAGSRELGGMFRGEHMEIGTLVGRGVSSELSGNVIDLCPVGALTNKPFRFGARSWEMLSHAAVSPHDCVGSNLSLHQLRGTVRRVVPRENEAVNEVWIADRDRYSYQGIRSHDRLERPRIRRNGQWLEVDWEDALSAAAEALRGVAGDDLGALVSPSATLEEMALAGRLVRGLGSDHVDHRLRQADFRDDTAAPGWPSLGLALEEIPSLDAVLVVGGYPRHDQPLFNHRLRRAALGGAAVWALNPRRFSWNLPVAGELVAGPGQLVRELALVVRALLDLTGGRAPAGLPALLDKAKPATEHQALAKALHDAGRAAVFTGNLVETHPDGAALRALAGILADLAGGSLGVLTQGANSAGGWLAGAVPGRRAAGAEGLDARAMLEQPREGYLLLGLEPEQDCWDAATALQALGQAREVVCLTPYVTDAMLEYASVLLPVGAYGETSGTYINAEGRWQSFGGVARPPGEARPAWRVLRVLGNLLELDGFEQQSSEDLLRELQARWEGASAGDWPRDLPEAGPPVEGLLRTGASAMYGTDPLVRRAAALQETVHAGWALARVAPETAARLGLDDGDRVRVAQGDAASELVLAVDDAVAADTVWLPAGLQGTAGLGPLTGPVTLERG